MNHQDYATGRSLMKVSCGGCSLHEMCLPRGLDERGLELLERVVNHARPLRRGAYLFDMGDPFLCLYAVRSGSLETYVRRKTAAEEIVGFHFPGELMGLDGITAGYHSCAAVALETTSVCKLPYDRLSELCRLLPGLHRQLTLLFAAELEACHVASLSLRRHKVAGRLATFLLNLSQRAKRRGLAAGEITMSMPCVDIANYLGVSTGALSRLLTHLRQEGILLINSHICEILDMPGLQAIADDEASDTAANDLR